MFIEKVASLIGLVPVQFEPLVYVMGFILFLWLIDGFLWLARYLVCGGRGYVCSRKSMWLLIGYLHSYRCLSVSFGMTAPGLGYWLSHFP